MNQFRDPVCGMMVAEGQGFPLTHDGQQWTFCSGTCRRAFQADPGKYLSRAVTDVTHPPASSRRIAYFSMEVAADSRMATYSGGLGVLAGDTLKTCADLRIPTVAVSLLYKNGYFSQRLDEWGNQREEPTVWKPSEFAHLLPVTVKVSIEGRGIHIRAWQYDIPGITGHCVPLLLLDTDFEPNTQQDQELTAWLYGGDQRYRLAQEIILGVGGVRMLRALGYTQLERFHMNEGHAALLVLELLNERETDWDFETVRTRCVFTTHTPVPAGHDQFPYELVQRVLTEPFPVESVQMLGGQDRLNMTLLALNISHYVNGVAKKHGEISQQMFPGYTIDSITNGVHSRTWTSASFRTLYDTFIPGWVNDPFALRYAISIPKTKIWDAHMLAKSQLIAEVNRRTGRAFSPEAFTLGFARRATPYKRADLLFADPSQLVEAAKTTGPIQILFSGKAHPRDESGKDLIRRIFQVSRQFEEQVKVAYLENYDMALAQLLTSGVDLWLNTPLRPLEASGTSGMKAAHNGVPSFSVLDGWWIEGHIEGVTGWSIGPLKTDIQTPEEINRQDAQDLYRKLRAVILPMFYNDRDHWTEVMRQAIAFNASFFNTHRMVQQYTTNAYL